jgi:hypothetical protein
MFELCISCIQNCGEFRTFEIKVQSDLNLKSIVEIDGMNPRIWIQILKVTFVFSKVLSKLN